MNDPQQNNQDQPGQDALANEGPGSSVTNENTNTNAVYLGDSSLQRGAAFEQDKKTDHSKEEDDAVSSSGVDDLQSNSYGAAATAERKTYGDTELNKGLEAQAKDEES
ncbi:MAG: hypothetical protein AVDCRST_MAG96-1194 [uncultured Segetibacter sp.]|uniref:Uncharacterized protein n=1 Tax=uncultured Segetibacter sp. TaxID=481133 RepID=A0A6J4RXZ1_9BACT|nr:MAG: hypothetical protein AVDCRST_MAG96-1194 [uncultured Segetibacter sp.]